MISPNYDVVVVGAGAAGLSAAIGLARAGLAVAVAEAAAFPGAENWSGCVYFAENLAHPDLLGPAGVEALAWERRLVERGFFATEGHGLLGMTYRDRDAFRHCYTVLRPIYDHHMAQLALRHGVALLNATTAESLIRDGDRIIGVCTQRGPLYAPLVFLAEGDASYLVTREGYERYADEREAPKFLQGIKQVIDLPPGAIEDVFGVGPDEGVAYEMLLRNGTLRGKPVRLNMGGFVYTNRQSLSVGLVLPADNLKEHFGGDPNLLLEWFEGLPALRPWLRQGRRGTFGAKIIRGGGARDIPNLIDNGLAIGGAASAIGIDFPYPNFTGPATAMGLLLAQAVARIRAEGGSFTRDELRRHYLEPLQQTHYWQDVEFLRRWPGYVKKSSVFFGPNLDLALGTAYIWTRPGRSPVTKWFNWLRLVLDVAGPGRWRELRADLHQLARAVRFRDVMDRPPIGRVLLDGTINALRDLFNRPRVQLPPAGKIRVHYTVAGGDEPAGRPPALVRRWFSRLAPVLASAARRVYGNDDRPLSLKLNGALQLLSRQVNLVHLVLAGVLGFAALLSGVLLVGWDRLAGLLRKRGRSGGGLYPQYARAARQTTDLTPTLGPAAQNWEARLAQLAYETVRASHIHVLWPRTIADKNQVTKNGLWHVCPAHVYEARVSPLGQLQVVVNYENCIKCETCWRTSDLVDWGRDGRHRFIYPVPSPAAGPLLEAVQTTGASKPREPLHRDAWEPAVRKLAAVLAEGVDGELTSRQACDLAEIGQLVARLDEKLQAFDAALADEPRTIDRARGEHLEMLARYAQQLAARLLEVVRDGSLAGSRDFGVTAVHERLLRLTTALSAKAEERARRTWTQRFSWAAADGRQLRFHHLTGLRRFLHLLASHPGLPALEPDPSLAWLKAEQDEEATAVEREGWRTRLDAALPPGVWRELEQQVPFRTEQDAVLRDLVAQVPALDLADLAGSLHPPLRKALLAELARRDPSLAYRAASHLWARDVASLATVSAPLSEAARRWQRGDEWACFAVVESLATADGRGEALFVPAGAAQSALLLVGDHLVLVRVGGEKATGVTVKPVAGLGLRGAGLSRITLDGAGLPGVSAAVDHDRIRRVWHALSAADLVSIAFGMADELCRRAVGHATTRVQFPGLFHDEVARDPIGKFGAVKKMIADMAARSYLIETLDHLLSPRDFSAPSVERAGLVKALAAEALGTAPGSVSYNAGQVFGGTGYSEDDILSKFYRDAAAWRFLGPPNPEVYRRHGSELLRGRADGHRLTDLADEAVLFDQVVQRKALQAELDGVRVARSRLRGLVSEWQAARRASRHGEGNGAVMGRATTVLAEAHEALARQDAHLLASKALLLRTHARLEHGRPAELETALLRVWLEESSVALHEFENLVQRALESDERPDDRPLVEPSAGPPVVTYADYLAAPAAYDSGDFLTRPIDLRQPRLVPEMVAADPVLAAEDQRFRDLLSGYFGQPRGPDLPYERFIERHHRPTAEDLDFCRAHAFFRMPIPPALGGEGGRKVDYYLLVSNAQRLADVAISLTIQVNTSIGTTPILLARDKDLPKAIKDLQTFRADAELPTVVGRELEAVLASLDEQDAGRAEQGYRALAQRLQKSVFGRPVLRVLAHRFADAWQQAGAAGLAFDLARMKLHLEEARSAWRAFMDQTEEMDAELGRRREACDLFLRWIAAGQISGFALTEPSAGSDTARVATRAQLRSVPVEVDADGVYRFVPAGAREPRLLLDAKRLEFRAVEADGHRGWQACYRWSDAAESAPIRFDEYDYETDDPRRRRYFEANGRRVSFTDIAQLREREGRLWYDYWELTGAKMWITNGRMAGVLCLYAKTTEGVTGFLVDRHAEGLIVGKDEAKMGQCGSPTNELALQAVRVSRENVLGLEGRGQVNALETLNVGRAGLSVTSMAQMAGLIEHCRAFARAMYGELPDWVTWRLARMEEERFISEAIAFEMVGRLDHPQTKSVRLESAIAKMLVTELLHHVIETAEEVLGLSGQTQAHLVEKRKRDARVLTIYEGTNEIQRFFILKDLASEVAPRWRAAGQGSAPQHLSREVLDLEALKAAARQRFDSALELFGQELWQNPNLQANCFLLAEAAAWLMAADSTLGRLAWLSRQELTASAPAPAVSANGSADWAEMGWTTADAGRRALARCVQEVRDRLRRIDEDLAQLRRGHYASEVRAASLLFDEAPKAAASAEPLYEVARPLSVLVVVEPSAGEAPHPVVEGGRLLEPHRTLRAADRAALETALRIRDGSAAAVRIGVAAVGPRGSAAVLREPLSLGVDRALLVVSEAEAIPAGSAASALAAVLGSGVTYDLVLGGDGEGEDGLTARLTAELLGMSFLGRARRVGIRATNGEAEALLVRPDGRQMVARPLPGVVAVEAGVTLRPFGVAGYLAGLARTVDLERWPAQVVAPRGGLVAGGVTAPVHAEEAPGPLDPAQAARRLLRDLGRGAEGPTVPRAYGGPIAEVAQPTGLEGGVIAMLAADSQGRLAPTANAVLHAGQAIAEACGTGLAVLLVAAPNEETQRRALARLAEAFQGPAVLLVQPEQDLAADVRGQVLAECWPALATAPDAVVAEPWAEPTLARLATRAGEAHLLHLRVRRVVREATQLAFETVRAGGKLRVRFDWEDEVAGTRWIGLAPEAEVVGARPAGETGLTVQRWAPRLERLHARQDLRRLLDEVEEEVGVPRLADADFILDVGFGVGNRDGYEAAIEPLERALRDLGVRGLVVGGSRKVTEELHLLPADRQIGQSGTAVNPRILLAVGVSGAPQHLNYIGPRATILAFNRDPEAPLMTLNRRQARPRVFPILGDLFETVPAFIQALRQEEPAPSAFAATGEGADGTSFAVFSDGRGLE
jgi:alkylation response protein AidB-like acyl-CoA dehydrogenase/flavin-dependent dehydrogenase/electron transfer flavoprotein alpha subunit/ferredoxin-like protein FixX